MVSAIAFIIIVSNLSPLNFVKREVTFYIVSGKRGRARLLPLRRSANCNWHPPTPFCTLVSLVEPHFLVPLTSIHLLLSGYSKYLRQSSPKQSELQNYLSHRLSFQHF